MIMKPYFFLAAAVMAFGIPFKAEAQKSPEEKLNMTMYAIMNMYVDTVDKASFVDDVIARTVKTLDPFSAYLTPEEVRANEAVLFGPVAMGADSLSVQAGGSSRARAVRSSYMVDDRTGYVCLTVFSGSAPEEFRSAVAGLRKAGMKNLILDLQGNPGGFVESAVEIADECLSGEKTVVTTSGAHVPANSVMTRNEGCFENGRLVLLVNGQTMSAAEILCGALRDWDRAVLVGSRTYGKGLIQETLPFEDGSALRITVARYLTPSGMIIQKPYEGYGRVYADTAATYRTLSNGRQMKACGGIDADVEVMQDTSFMTSWYYNLTFNGFQKTIVSSYIDRNRDALLKEFRTSDSFFRKFHGEDGMLAELVDAADAAGLSVSEVEYDRTAPALKTQLKALLARELYPEDLGRRGNPLQRRAHRPQLSARQCADPQAAHRDVGEIHWRGLRPGFLFCHRRPPDGRGTGQESRLPGHPSGRSGGRFAPPPGACRGLRPGYALVGAHRRVPLCRRTHG